MRSRTQGCRRNLTLLEVMIALSLTAILLSVLFTFYRETMLYKGKIQKVKEQTLSHQLVQQRLGHLFSAIHSGEKEEKNSPFYLGNSSESSLPALYVQYDNGIDPNPAFSHVLTSTLFYSKTKELYLSTASRDGGTRKELLATQVDSLSFAFYHPEKGEWVKNWDEKEKEVPSIVKLILGDSSTKEKVEFAFFPQISQVPVTY